MNPTLDVTVSVTDVSDVSVTNEVRFWFQFGFRHTTDI